MFHTIADTSSVIFDLHWQFFADAKIFEVERLNKVKCLQYEQATYEHKGEQKKNPSW